MATRTTNYGLYKPDPTDNFGDFLSEFNANMDEIDNNLGGGSGSGGAFLLMITADTGLTVTATKDGTTLTATEVSTGVYEVEVTSAGTWTLSDGTNTATVDVGIYTATLSSVPEGSTVLPTDDISIWLACGERTEGYTTLSQVLGDSVCLSALLNNNNANDYLVRSTTWASTITADSLAMSYIGLNNYCSNTLLSDTTWREAICNSEYFESVLNVKVPTMTSNTTPSGECISSGANQASEANYKAFDGDADTLFSSSGSGTGAGLYLGYSFDAPTKVYLVKAVHRANTTSAVTMNFKYQSKTSDGDWNDISETFNVSFNKSTPTTMTVVSSGSNDVSYRIYRNSSSIATRLGMWTLQFYGREDV